MPVEGFNCFCMTGRMIKTHSHIFSNIRIKIDDFLGGLRNLSLPISTHRSCIQLNRNYFSTFVKFLKIFIVFQQNYKFTANVRLSVPAKVGYVFRSKQNRKWFLLKFFVFLILNEHKLFRIKSNFFFVLIGIRTQHLHEDAEMRKFGFSKFEIFSNF